MRQLPYLIILLLTRLTLSSLGQTNPFQKIDSLILAPEYEQALKDIQAFTQTTLDQSLLPIAQNKESEVLILLGRIKEAEVVLQSISTANDPYIEAVTKSNIGFLRINQARFDEADVVLRQSYEAFAKAAKVNTKEGARCLANMALLYSSTGKYNQARDYELQSLQIRERLFGSQSEEVAASLNDLGLIYSQLDTDVALEYYDKAAAIYEKIHGQQHPKIAISKANIGYIYQQQELYGDAINSFEECRSIWEKIYPQGHPNVAQVNLQLGDTYQKLKNQAVALQFFEKALVILKKSYGNKHPDISQALNKIGLIKLNEQKFDEALKTFQDALIANAPGFNSADILQQPEPSDYYNARVMLYSLHFKAQAWEARHYGKTLKLSDLVQALECLRVSDKLIDNIRHLSADEGDKLALSESANEVYEDGVKIAESISLITINAMRYRELAFYFAEKSKSAVLQESIADTQAKSFAGIPNELLEREKVLKSDIALLAQKLSQKPSGQEEQTLRQSLFAANQQYAAFTKDLEQRYPNYFNLKFNTATATIPEIQKTLDAETTVVSYFISERHQRLYIFVISKSTSKLLNRSLPSGFERLVKGYTNSLYYSDFDTYRQSASVLSKLLMPTIRQSKLIIIPSGRLGTIPFEALNASRGYSSFSNVKYLVQQYSISYEFSAGLLLQKSKNVAAKIESSIFLCAPVRFNQRSNLGDLPGTEAEINSISNLFSSRAKSAKFEDASEINIKESGLENYDYLHFATHGIVDEINPELSRIFLNPSAQDDGDLYSGEIYNLKLNAELAVLSACQTGLGKFSKGEGVIGLSRALTYAGARNIIVSYWSVSDESTALMMNDFYVVLLNDPTRDFSHALHAAKLKLSKSAKYSAPYYWAPFILIGK